jgi:predicted nucleotidyltransferase
MRLETKTLDRLIEQIVAIAKPHRIVLFGSAARGDMQEGSDVDLMVVVPDGTHRRHTAQDLYEGIYRALPRLGIAFDLLVATETDLKRHAATPGLIYAGALRDGRLVYEAK